MNNEHLFDLTSPPSGEFDTAQKCFDTSIIMQNKWLCSGARITLKII